MYPTRSTPAPRAHGLLRGRKKWLAIVLALIISGWAWLYTYRINRGKFWAFAGLWLIDLIIPAVVYANTAFSLASWQDFLPAALVYVGSALFSFGLWLWAVIDTIRTPADVFRQYPQRGAVLDTQVA